jgi:hypothetical protein
VPGSLGGVCRCVRRGTRELRGATGATFTSIQVAALGDPAARCRRKLLVLPQFRPSMINGESALDTRHDDLAIVIHMDGQGRTGNMQQTWDAITGAAPRGVYFGWNFFVKDHPMLTPSQTMARAPQPTMISYQ